VIDLPRGGRASHAVRRAVANPYSGALHAGFQRRRQRRWRNIGGQFAIHGNHALIVQLLPLQRLSAMARPEKCSLCLHGSVVSLGGTHVGSSSVEWRIRRLFQIAN
jgi:hypothetical protein